MRIFLTRGVARFVRAEGISVQRLVDAIARAERGLIDAELGGGLISGSRGQAREKAAVGEC